VFSYLRTLTTWHCPLQRSIEICCTPGISRTRHTLLQPANGTDRQTDVRKDTVPFHRPYSAYNADSANKYSTRSHVSVYSYTTTSRTRSSFVRILNITGCRQPCVNGDWLCQREMAIFDPPQNKHPLTDHQKIGTDD